MTHNYPKPPSFLSPFIIHAFMMDGDRDFTDRLIVARPNPRMINHPSRGVVRVTWPI